MSSLARPKSVILGVPSAAIRILAGDRSRCTTPMRCAEWMARARASIVRADHSAGWGVPARRLRQRAALDQLQDQERRAGVLAHAVDLHDAGVVQPRHGLGLVPEPREHLGMGQGAGVEHLHRDLALQLGLPGAVDDPHAAPAQDPQDLVTGELGLGRGSVRRLGAAPHRQRGVVPRGRRPAASSARCSSTWSFSSPACRGKRSRNSSRGGSLAPLLAEQVLGEDQVDGRFGVVPDRGEGVEIGLGRHPLAQPASLGLVNPQGHGDLLGVADAGLLEEVDDAGLLAAAPEAPQVAGRDRRRRGRAAGASASADGSPHSWPASHLSSCRSSG